jgi:hypothetical protein
MRERILVRCSHCAAERFLEVARYFFAALFKYR